MSKKAKSEAKLRRRQKKRAAKAAQRARYELWVREGRNSKSKRFRLNAKRRKGVRTQRHLTGRCGNIGCQKCNLVLGNVET
jgi:hypothetical protein